MEKLVRLANEGDTDAFIKYFGEQFTTAEIAELLHMKENTVKSRIRRGKIQLRKQMEGE